MALFALQFSKFSGGACPPTPPREVPPSAVAFPSPEKILLFHKISMEALNNNTILTISQPKIVSTKALDPIGNPYAYLHFCPSGVFVNKIT